MSDSISFIELAKHFHLLIDLAEASIGYAHEPPRTAVHEFIGQVAVFVMAEEMIERKV